MNSVRPVLILFYSCQESRCDSQFKTTFHPGEQEIMETKPLVGILMGSESDLPVMRKAAAVLKDMGVAFEMDISSAHRLPDKTADYARTARERGLEVIIAGAGMAAHLAGVIAAHTTLPVIGVPLASGALNGEDALHSTVQMPPGIPVATVAIDGAKNSAYLACSILSIKYPELSERLHQFREDTRKTLMEKSKQLQQE
jgi:5-(carboxyamino)imidazole ribonucleotide mutase